jgi:hypothetical protein
MGGLRNYYGYNYRYALLLALDEPPARGFRLLVLTSRIERLALLFRIRGSKVSFTTRILAALSFVVFPSSSRQVLV